MIEDREMDIEKNSNSHIRLTHEGIWNIFGLPII